MTSKIAALFREAGCVVFDFDGVILESEWIKEDGFRYLFREAPEKVGAVNDYLLANPSIPRTIRIPALFEIVYGRAVGDGEFADLSRQFSAFVHDRVRQCPEVAGARQLLETLHGETPLYVSSATPQDELRDICGDRNFGMYFEDILGAPVTKPEHMTGILASENLLPKALLFIGDSPADQRAAAAVGVPFLLRVSSVAYVGDGCPCVRDFAGLAAELSHERGR